MVSGILADESKKSGSSRSFLRSTPPVLAKEATPNKHGYGYEALLSSQFKAPRPAAAPVANDACSR